MNAKKYLVTVVMETKNGREGQTRTFEIYAITDNQAKQRALAEAKEDHNERFSRFKVKSCQRDK